MTQVILFFVLILIMYFIKGRKFGILFFPLMLILSWWFVPWSGHLIPGIFGMTTFEVLLYLGVIQSVFFNSKRFSHNNHLVYIKTSFIFLILFGSIGLITLSKDKDFGSLFFRNATLIPLLVIVLFIKTINTKEKLLFMVNAFIISTSIFAIVLLTNYIFKSFTYNLGDRMDINVRLGGIPTIPFRFQTYYSAVPLGASLAAIFAFFLPLLAQKVFFEKKHLYIFPSILLIISIFLAGTRGAWLALISSLLFFLIISPGLKRKVVILTSLLLMGIFVYIFIIEFSNDLINDRLLSISDMNNDKNYIQRLYYIDVAMNSLSKNLWGIGFGREGRVIINEHNMYSFIALGTGIVGVIIFVLLLFYFVRITIKQSKQSIGYMQALSIGGATSIICILINGTSDSILMESFQANAISIIIAFLVVTVSINKEQKVIIAKENL